MIRRPPRSTLSSSSAASDVYKRQSQRRSRQRTFRFNLQKGKIISAVSTHHDSLVFLLPQMDDCHLFRAGDDMLIGQHIAIWADDDTGPTRRVLKIRGNLRMLIRQTTIAIPTLTFGRKTLPDSHHMYYGGLHLLSNRGKIRTLCFHSRRTVTINP